MENKPADLFWVDILILLNMSGIFNTENFYFNFVFNPLILEFLMGCLLAYTSGMKLLSSHYRCSWFSPVCSDCFSHYLKGFGHQLGREGFGFRSDRFCRVSCPLGERHPG
jgi:hypothetical protein